jgi:CHAT domain-containing protein
VVHFATHAVVSDTRPLESFLALAPGDGSDGRLTSAEIYGWHLAADLVVLSACRTARGRVNGDGVIGLSRAFAYAGTPSLIASVWDAPDQTSRELFPTFYAEWQRTGDRAGALRTAQLALIRRLRAGEISVSTPAGPVTLQERPALWAPFVLLGEP